MTTLEGFLFNGRQPIALAAKMEFTDMEATLSAEVPSAPLSGSFQISELRVSPRSGSSARFISLPNGSQFTCKDSAFLDSLPQESASEGFVAWLEARWGVALACVALVGCVLAGAYFFGLPRAAEYAAAHIPLETEESLGTGALSWLDQSRWFMPSAIEPQRRKAIEEGFQKLIESPPAQGTSKRHYRLAFRSAPRIGPNAFALPGGSIVVTDDMVRFSETNEEILAILAHEIGHVELRHPTRSLMQNSVIAIATAAVTSDAATFSAAVAGLPALLAQSRYSRTFETEADNYAFALLPKKGYSPEAFAAIMERLANATPGGRKGSMVYISSHPDTWERIRRAHEAARRAQISPRPPEENKTPGPAGDISGPGGRP
jgi:predicted Zn-dependent protease